MDNVTNLKKVLTEKNQTNAATEQNVINEQQMKLNAVLMSKKFILIDGKTASIFAEGINPAEAMKLLNLTHSAFTRELVQQVVFDTLDSINKAAAEEEARIEAEAKAKENAPTENTQG